MSPKIFGSRKEGLLQQFLKSNSQNFRKIDVYENFKGSVAIS
jgi:hypothetical protein